MATLHFRHASVNTATALEERPQTHDGTGGSAKLSPRPWTPSPGHSRMQSIGYTEKVGGQDAAQPLLSEDKELPVALPTIPRRLDLAARAGGTVLVALWILSLALSSLFTYLLTRSSVPASGSPFGTFATGFSTELRAAKVESLGHIHKRHFTGSLDFKDRHGFVPPGSDSLKYFGSGPAIDAAWDQLTLDRYFLLTDAEAREAYGQAPTKYWNEHHGGYVAGLDVLHTLHCLNHLRMSLYPQVYPQDPEHGATHKMHCVDHLRQLAMCNSDLTPVPTQFFPGLGRNYINSSREHTCRDFNQVRSWATERFNGSTAVKARNRDGTLRANFYAPWGP